MNNLFLSVVIICGLLGFSPGRASAQFFGGGADGYGMKSDLSYCTPAGFAGNVQTSEYGIVKVLMDEDNQAATLIFTARMEGICHIAVYDVLGHLIFMKQENRVQKGINEVKLDFSSVRHGIYLVTLTNSKTTIACKIAY